MDVAALLGWLALAVALNTSVTAILAVLTIRSGLGAGRADLGRRATAGPRARRGGGAPTGAAVRAAPGRPVGPGPVTATEGSDPLAGAIEAFLGRSDGLFRAGGPPPGHLSATGRPPRPAAGPGAPVGPPPRPPIVSAHDRPLSEVTWATSRPSRFVPSGPHPAEGRVDAEDRGDATSDAATSGSSAIAPAGRSASRVSIALSGRDGSGAGAGMGAVARLGPVIGGFIRERTRDNDRVTGLTGGRYNVVLLDTPLDGAAALIQRLTQSCDAWLAAEQPPLRLEFGSVELPGYTAAGGPAPTRASGPERRRAVAPGA